MQRKPARSGTADQVNYAKWEPGHGPFKYQHPWTQYQKISDLTRRCACRAEALYGYLHSQIQASKQVKDKLKEPCIKMSIESCQALKELSFAISTMRKPSMAKPHIQNAVQNLDLLLSSSTLLSGSTGNLTLLEFTPATTVASLLSDIIGGVEEIEVAVEELATPANFRDKGIADGKNDGAVDPEFGSCSFEKLGDQGSMKRCSFKQNEQVIMIEGSSNRLSQDHPSLSMVSHNGVE